MGASKRTRAGFKRVTRCPHRACCVRWARWGGGGRGLRRRLGYGRGDAKVDSRVPNVERGSIRVSILQITQQKPQLVMTV